MRRFRSTFWFGLGVFCALALWAVIAFSHRTIHLSEHRIQNELATRFPFGKHELIYDVEFENPRVDIDASSDHLTLLVDAKAAALGSKPIKGKVSVNGVPRYETATGGIYLDHPRALITDLDFADLPEKYRSAVSKLMASALEGFLLHKPIYRLQEGDQKAFVLRRSLKSLSVKNGELVIELGL